MFSSCLRVAHLCSCADKTPIVVHRLWSLSNIRVCWTHMDFTEIYGQTTGLVAFSPGAHFILTAVQDRVIIRRADSFQIARTWHIDGESSSSSTQPPAKGSNLPSQGVGSDTIITHAGWSCDSEYVLAACAKRGVVSVYKLRDETWHARIDAGAEGLVKAEWAPDGRTILIFSSWGVRQDLSLVSTRLISVHSSGSQSGPSSPGHRRTLTFPFTQTEVHAPLCTLRQSS